MTMSLALAVLGLPIAIYLLTYLVDWRRARQARIPGAHWMALFQAVQRSEVFTEAEKRAELRRLYASMEEWIRTRPAPFLTRLGDLLLECARRRRK
jgi:hypothetical protein